MQGVPGSGKSTVARAIAQGSYAIDEAIIISTDDYWDRGGIYAFETGKLGQAHRWNQERCLQAMQEGHGLIIVDNTNIQKKAAVPYVGLASVFGYSVQVVRVDPGLDVAIARNVERTPDRQVPEGVIRDMYARMETLLPVA